MNNIESLLSVKAKEAVKALYGADVNDNLIQFQKTRKEFEGDRTLVVFPLLKTAKKKPEQTAEDIGNYLKENTKEVVDFNIVKGFLNLVVSDEFWIDAFEEISAAEKFGVELKKENPKTVVVEYSSPNTNKPLHLGHIRNNLLGYAISNMLKAAGDNVKKVNLVNDRGIHICKSMYAWQEYGKGETPESSGKKGDHLVGDYYVKFDQEYKKEVAALLAKGMEQKEAETQAPSLKAVQEMLRKWEAGDKEVTELWSTMNGWVYDGFDVTYKELGVDFDKIYYESETYLLGKDIVLDGLKKDILLQKEDGSVWADLTDRKLDQKILLRSDGTSVYMTQDIGTAKLRQDDYNADEMVYVVGNEQNYHFQVLSIVLEKLGFEWGKKVKHLSYGMVELPEGKMKSREGTVVDADDLIAEMVDTARSMSEELGKLDGFSEEEKNNIYKIIGLGALKYFIIKVDPKKNMTFNPKESIDFNGNTGPFIQYTYARINSLIKKAADKGLDLAKVSGIELNQSEKELIKQIYLFPETVQEAAEGYNPGVIANYCYDLAKQYNQFYHDNPVLVADDDDTIVFRVKLSSKVSKVIRDGMALLGIDVPERM